MNCTHGRKASRCEACRYARAARFYARFGFETPMAGFVYFCLTPMTIGMALSALHGGDGIAFAAALLFVGLVMVTLIEQDIRQKFAVKEEEIPRS